MTKFNILYVEDDKETRENYTFLLKNFFTEVNSCSTGEEAINLYENNKFDLLIIDINLPFKSGLEVADYIRRKDDKINIIMLTAYSDRVRLLQAVSLKLEDYLIKPINDRKLIDTIDIIIKRIENSKNSKDMIYLTKELYWSSKFESLFYKNEEFNLTQKEQKLFKLLIKKIGLYIDRDELILSIWFEVIPDNTHNQKLTQLIYRFNKKIIERTSIKEQIIKNNYSFGYKIDLNN